MWVYGIISILDGNNEISSVYNAKTWVDEEDTWTAIDRATAYWDRMFENFGAYVVIDDVWAK